jgi:hypothetical protein
VGSSQKFNDATAAAIITLDFDSMEALSLISAEDLTKSKITTGTQKLLLKGVRQAFVSADDHSSNMADGENQLSAAGSGQLGVNMTPSSSFSGANAVSGGNVSNTASAQGENQRDTYVQEIISQLQQTIIQNSKPKPRYRIKLCV